MIFCPVCTGAVQVVSGLVTVINSDNDTNVRWATLAACTSCAMVSEVQDDTMIDMCNLELMDLRRPFIGVEVFSRVACLASLHGRRDS